MKVFKSLSIIVLAFSLNAQEISISEIWQQYKFVPGSIQKGKPFGKNGFTYISKSGVDLYSFKNFQKQSTLIPGQLVDYSFSKDESKALLQKTSTPIYRHSTLGAFEVFDLKTKDSVPIFDRKEIQEPLFSPDNEKVAFVFENNLYVQDLSSNKVVQITNDGERNKIINGINDWVYEEEFGFVRNFDWSPDGRHIAYLRLDETEVPEISIDLIGNQLYPEDLTFKYPKAGEKNSEVSVWVHDLNSGQSEEVKFDNTEMAYYIPHLAFAPNGDLMVVASNRHQNRADVWRINPTSLSKNVLFTETDKAWIETDNFILDFINDDEFIWASERDGFRHLYHYNINGELLGQLTKGKWEVVDFYGYNPDNQNIYYQSTETGSWNLAVIERNIKTKKRQLLSPDDGSGSAFFSKDYNYYLLTHSTGNQPPQYSINNGNGKTVFVLEDNERIKTLQKTKGVSKKQYFTVDLPGRSLNAWRINPPDYDPNGSKKHPMFMFVYGGPGSQTTANAWDYYNYWWFQMLAQMGYVVVSVDNRGTGHKGAEFKKSTYMNLGKLETQDQIDAAKLLSNEAGIDENRIGIFGWSYGGYMSSLALTKGADVFKMAIAVAPVTNWRFYDTIYTERFMRTPQENPSGYDDNSPINYVDQMKGAYLLVHGSADDNVHYQNSMRMAESLIQLGKEFDFMAYPDKNHGIYGGNTRFHLYTKMTKFIQENL